MHRNTKSTKVMSKSHHEISHLSCHIYHLLCVLGLVCFFTSCHWHEAKNVIATADSIDQTEHVIYDDTAALRNAIRCLDNPFSRVLMSNTLGKAYYYMGRNLEDNYLQVAEAAKCYIEADRLQIDDPIYRGRVNSCMGYICEQNNNDSLAFIFYEQAGDNFRTSEDKWYYAQNLLSIIPICIHLQLYTTADSLLQIAKIYHIDSTYLARLYETQGIYFYDTKQYDSALVYLNRGLEFWPCEKDRCHSYLKIMQTYYFDNISIDSAMHYAHKLINTSNNPNYISNAYYCLMQEAKNNNDVELLSQYSHARTDAQKLLRDGMVKDAEAVVVLAEYLKNPFPMRWIRIVLFSFVILCLILAVSIFVYRKHTITRMQVSEEQIVHLSAQVLEHQDELQQQTNLHRYDNRLDKIRKKYPKPLNRWNEYAELKKDIQPYLHNWFMALEDLDLTNREKVFCVVSFVYPQMATEDLANYLCITKDALPVRKNRIAKKFGVTSVELGVFLQKLANSE